MQSVNPKIKKLREEQTSIQAELEQLQHQNQRLKNRIAYLNKGERMVRAHRLITRGAAIESIVPEVKPMDERSFYALMEEILLRPDIATHIRRSVSGKGGDL